MYLRKAIEGFNSKLKKETRRRVMMNSEENVTIVITFVYRDYNKSAGRITQRHFS